jgi:hypothetical protein
VKTTQVTSTAANGDVVRHTTVEEYGDSGDDYDDDFSDGSDVGGARADVQHRALDAPALSDRVVDEHALPMSSDGATGYDDDFASDADSEVRAVSAATVIQRHARGHMARRRSARLRRERTVGAAVAAVAAADDAEDYEDEDYEEDFD